MDPKTGMEGCGKSRPPTGIRSPDRPIRSESLYGLRYPGQPVPFQILSNSLFTCLVSFCPSDSIANFKVNTYIQTEIRSTKFRRDASSGFLDKSTDRHN